MNILDVLFQQSSLERLIRRFERFFHKFPHLPLPLMEFLVSLLPSIFFALGILHAVIGAMVIINGAHLITQLELASSSVNIIYLFMNGMLAVANGIFMLFAFNEIRRETLTGWHTLLLINSVSILQSILSILFSPQVIISVLIYIAVTLYITFEFKPYFRKHQTE